MSRFFPFFLGLVVTLVFTGCTQDLLQGRQMISSEARSWQVYESEEKVVFSDEANTTVSFTAGERKSLFNEVSDCYDVSQIQTKCDHYSMEYDHVLLKTVGSQIMLTYAVEKQVKEGKLFDCLTVNLQQKDFLPLKGQLALSDGVNKIDQEMRFLPTITLHGKTFESVYEITNDVTGQSIYVTKNQGVVGFKTNENVWVLKL